MSLYRMIVVIGVASVLGQSYAAEESSIAIDYTLAQDAKVSLLIAGEQGVVRELLHAAPQKKGKYSVPWDALDEAGQPVPAGAYTWKLLSSQGLKAEYMLTVGTNPKPRWGLWVGNHRGVCSVAADATGMYVATDGGEGGGLALKTDWNDNQVWVIPHWFQAWCGMAGMAAMDGQLYMFQRDEKVYRVDAGTGEQNAKWDLVAADDPKVVPFGMAAGFIADLDANAGQLVLSYYRHDVLKWIDPKSGKILDEAAVPEPMGVAVDGKGAVFVISKGQVLSLNREHKTPIVIVPQGQLTDPFRLAVDPLSGDILVAENSDGVLWAAKAKAKTDVTAMALWYTQDNSDAGHQVKRFDRTGKLVATYGREGRRLFGRYNPSDFNNIADIAATPNGGFVICESESAPRRTAYFDKNGSLVREWYGGQKYANAAWPDSKDPREVWIRSSSFEMIHAKVDYARKDWRVHAVYSYREVGEWFGWPGDIEFRPLRHDGKTYLCNVKWDPMILRVDEASGRLLPVVVTDMLIEQSWGDVKVPTMKHSLVKDVVGKNTAGSLIWTDRDGDGFPPKADEITVSKWRARCAGFMVDDDFNYYFEMNEVDDVKNIARLSPVSWSDKGVPQYDFAALQGIASAPRRNENNHPRDANHPAGAVGVMPDADGNIFAAWNWDYGVTPFGQGFWGARSGVNLVSKWKRDGTLLWTVGRHAAGAAARPGEAKYFWRLTGTTHGCIVIGDVEDGMQHVYDQDGLFVGRLAEEPFNNEAPNTVYTTWAENFSGMIYTAPADASIPGVNAGDVLFFAGGVNNNPVFRIHGWDTFKRQHGQLRLTEEQTKKIKAREDTEAARTDLAHAPYLASITLDGDLGEWKAVKPIAIKDGAEVRAKVYLAWNAEDIYAAFDVNTTSPWKTSATDEQLSFQGGAAVDVNIGPFEPVRKEPIAGDLRAVVAPINGKARIVEYLPVPIPGMREFPATYQTLNGKVTFAFVSFREDWRVASKVKADGSGYVVELRIPNRPPLEIRPGLRFRFDASVLLADPSGTKTLSRLPWHSRDPGDMAVQDAYSEALLRPHNWGEAVLDK